MASTPIHTNTLSHPILMPLSYENQDVEKGFPEADANTESTGRKDATSSSSQSSKNKPMRRFLAFLKRSKLRAADINTLQAQQERERVELMDENWTIAYYAVACLLVLMSLAAINIHWDSSLVKFAFLFPLITAPLTVIQRQKINKASCKCADEVQYFLLLEVISFRFLLSSRVEGRCY
jgi:hypothetical protein